MIFRVYVGLIACATLWAQADRGTVAGVLADSSGGVVAGAAIEAVQNGTNFRTDTTSTATGAFRLVGLPTGIYVITIKAPGFQTQVRRDVQVQVNQTAVLDATLTVGNVAESITVEASVPLIQAESSDVGLVVQGKQILELPLTLGGAIRNPSAFIKLAPGVTPGSTWTKSISGGGAFQDMVYYDGIALSRGDIGNDGEVNPSVDAIGEFKLITNNYSAEYAHAMGGITSFTMKSGTNDFHGTAFYFVRNEKLDARNFFAPSRAPSKQNEWGLTGGGPVLLPGIYNGKDKTFWFFSFDQFYRRGGQLNSLNTIATSRMQEGDFGELPRIIYDPATNQVGANGQIVRTAFPGNVIPRSRWSKVSSVMLPYHPKPDRPGLQNNAIARLDSPWADNRTMGFKLDHQITSNHRVSGMFNLTDRPRVITSFGNTGLLPVGDTTALTSYNDQRVQTKVVHVNFDSTLTPTTLNHVGLGYSMFRNPLFAQSVNQGWTQPDGGKLGLKGLQYDMFPVVRFDTDGYVRYGQESNSDNHFHTFTALDTLTLIRGNHTVKMGFEVQHHRDNFRNANVGGGLFRFRRDSTGQPGVANSGDAWASFLLGEVYAGESFFAASIPGGRYTTYGSFIDDQWKVTQRLTLNFGFRWEIVVPHSDPLGRISYMDIATPNAAAGNRPGAMVYGGESGFGNRYLNILWWNPAPRVGFAYRLGDRTVFRGGAGIFNSNYINQGLGLPAFGFSTLAQFTTGDNGVTPAFNWDGGFPQTFRRPPVIDPTAANGQPVTTVFPSEFDLPRKLQWNFTIERQFGENLSMSFAYVANKGTHLYETQQINQVATQHLSLGVNTLRANINSAEARAAGVSEPFPGFARLWGAAATVAQALRPFPQYGAVDVYGSTYGNSSYQSFQYRLDKRFSRGFSGTLAYTWSKFLTDARQYDGISGKQNEYLREKSYHPQDVPQILTFSYQYQLPFGKGQTWLKSGFGSAIAGGWLLGGVHAYSSGARLGITTANTMPLFNSTLRPHQSADARSSVSMSDFDPARDRYLNPAAFSNPVPGTFGTAPRYLETRGPMRIDESFALLKNASIRERVTLQFRVEILNPLNRAVFGNPVTNFAAANFGTITSTQIDPRSIQLGMKLQF